jgi:cellulose synthase/poly-beta-1,6-N-acetylglucosamine synthase-like glycosyltransferase
VKANFPFISIIVPCRNEEKFIGKCLDSIIVQDYPKNRFQVLVVDGMSEDGTRKVIKKYTKRYSFIKLLDNPQRITPCGLNLGIKNSQGELIFWMSAHNEYEKEYTSKCIKYMKKFDADAVGGIIKPIPRNNSFIGKSICIALSHPFGVGNSAHKTGINSSKWVDAAFGGCYKKEIFQKVGLFNENLVGTQDMEFCLRLRRAGYKTLLVPDIVSYYYARSDLKSFCKYNLRNGLWAILPFKFTDHAPVSWRHLVPLAFVSSFMGSLGLWGLLSLLGSHSFWSSLSLLSFLLIVGWYSLCNLFFSARIALKGKDLRYLFVMPVIFAVLHIGYGLGSVWGLIKCSGSKRFWRNLRGILTGGELAGGEEKF